MKVMQFKVETGQKVLDLKVCIFFKLLDLKVDFLSNFGHFLLIVTTFPFVNKVYFPRPHKFVSTVQGHNGDVAAMSLHPSQVCLLVWSDLSTEYTIHPSQEGVFVTGSVDKTARLWDLRFNYLTFEHCSIKVYITNLRQTQRN